MSVTLPHNPPHNPPHNAPPKAPGETLDTTSPNRSTELKRGALGVGFIIFFVVSAASPLSVIAGGFPIGIMLGNGAGTPALLILALLVLLAFSVGYTTLSRHITNAGGFYAFTARGLGGLAGGAAGVLAMFAYNILQVGLYGMFGGVVSGTMESAFGLVLPWWSYSLMAMASIAILGYRKIDLSARVLSVMVIAEYLAILILDFAILKSGGDSGINLDSFSSHQVFSGTPSIGLLFCFAAFIGFEATTIYGEEARDPQRTIPLATYCSVLLIGGFYALSVWSMVVGVGADKIVPMLQALQDPTTFIYGMSDHFVGPHLTQVIRVLFMVSIYAGLLAFHNAAARYFYAIGRDGLLHRQLGTTHRVHQSPHMGSALQSLISAVVVLIFAAMDADPILQLFAWLSNLATLCVILLMALTSAAVLVFFRRHPELKVGVWRGQIFPGFSCLALWVVLVLAVVHFDVLTGASQLLSYSLCAIIPLALLGGVFLAARLRKVSPQRFLALGSHKL